jgi:hypothetical protein
MVTIQRMQNLRRSYSPPFQDGVDAAQEMVPFLKAADGAVANTEYSRSAPNSIWRLRSIYYEQPREALFPALNRCAESHKQ